MTWPFNFFSSWITVPSKLSPLIERTFKHFPGQSWSKTLNAALVHGSSCKSNMKNPIKGPLHTWKCHFRWIIVWDFFCFFLAHESNEKLLYILTKIIIFNLIDCWQSFCRALISIVLHLLLKNPLFFSIYLKYNLNDPKIWPSIITERPQIQILRLLCLFIINSFIYL